MRTREPKPMQEIHAIQLKIYRETRKMSWEAKLRYFKEARRGLGLTQTVKATK